MENERLEKAIIEIIDVIGYNNVFLDEPTRNLYSYDASMVKAKPLCVLNIKDINQIAPVVKILYNYNIPYTPRLAGTNLSGGATNQRGGAIINLTSCDRIIAIDTANQIAIVEPGVVNLKLQNELERYGFFYPPDPASQKISTIGGNIAENAGGPQCLKYGVTSNNIVRLEVVLPDGSECEFDLNDYGPQIMSLFAGSEGTLGIIKKAYLKILPLPQYFLTIYAEFKSIEESMKSVVEVIKNGIIPKAMEVVDRITVLACGKESEIEKETESLLITEIDSNCKDEIEKNRIEIIKIFEKNSAVKIQFSNDREKSSLLWKIRKDAYPSLAKISNNIIVEDGAVPRSKLVNAVKNIKKIINENGIVASLVFHAGDGNIHPNITFDERDVRETNRIRRVAKEIIKEYIINGGTISSEHGIGVEKRGFLPLQHSRETINLLKNIKKEIDEKNISNPDKKLPLTTNIKKLNREEHRISDNVKELIEEVKRRHNKKIKSFISSYQTYLKKQDDSIPLSTTTLTNIIDLDSENMTITLECGLKATEVIKFLSSNGLSIFLPPSQSSIGSIIARNEFIEIRDMITSMDIILSNGEIVRFGGKIFKDNSTYDVIKLMIGSWGSLGIITSVTFKIFKEIKNLKFTKPLNRLNITPLHIKIKKAFDPDNLFNPFLTEKLYGKKL